MPEALEAWLLQNRYNLFMTEEIEPGMREIRPGVWRLRVYAGRGPNGSPLQITRTVVGDEGRPGGGVRKARAELAKLRSSVARGQVPTGSETMGELLGRWLAHCESKGLSPTTMRKYRSIAETVVRPELGKVRLSKLTAGHLDRLYTKLAAKGNKATTIRRAHALIGAALHSAERWDLVERNVARRAAPPPVRPAQITAPSPAEVQAILRAADELDPGLTTLLLLAALTGARRGELCALRWSDLDAGAGTLSIARSVYETAKGGWGEKGTKSHQVRKIGLDALALEALRRHRAAVDATASGLGLEIGADAFMFSRSPVGSEPVRPDVVTRFAGRAAGDAGVRTHLHALRHFSATQGIAAGYDPVTVGARLGHADPSITLRVYSHALERRDRDLAATVGKTLALPSA
jgi:integrase